MQTERKKVFRSVNGCTVCYAKSGQHPFQNSNKWTKYIQKVFNLNENRTNKVCSSCVKHILKWRRTPKHSRPDLSHIVKTAPLRRPSNRKARTSSSIELDSEKKDDNKTAVTNEIDELSSESDLDGDLDDAYFETSSPDSTFSEEYVMKQYKDASSQTSFLYPALTSPQANAFKLPYIDLSKWRQEQICCGVIFRGPSGEVLVDPKWLNPSCSFCDRSCSTPSPPKESKEINIFDEKLASLLASSS
ncbi:SIN3-HDAC complex-associated factor [Hydra vulgaris]|uniref:Protein FAM60A n=1 Tax=Hydra vulgaris TaxID=6087 RepID=T2M4I7_HYDVU|nr:SIN3-HDAC complex-associated factor [Hydra vulgaris]